MHYLHALLAASVLGCVGAASGDFAIIDNSGSTKENGLPDPDLVGWRWFSDVANARWADRKSPEAVHYNCNDSQELL